MTTTSYWAEQTVIVTGGSGLIGGAIARHLAKLGSRVATTFYANASAAEKLVRECPGVQIFQVDAANENQVETCVEAVEKLWGPCTVLINCAGMIHQNLLVTTTSEEWRKVLDTHLSGYFYFCRRVVPGMMRLGSGRILNISSIAGIRGIEGQVAYSAAKGGVIALTKAVAREVGRKSITCNALVLGMIGEDMLREKVGMRDEQIAKMISSKAIKRSGQVEDVVGAVEYFVGPFASYVTAQTLTIDGGAL